MKRCIACEVRVNLNYPAKVYFTVFYWFKSSTWQCKSNRACAKVTWKPRKQQTWRLILRWRKVHSGLTFTPTMKLCNLLLKWLLGSNLSHIVHFVHPNCKWYRFTSSWGTRASYSETSCDILFFSEPPTQYQETHSIKFEKNVMVIETGQWEIKTCVKWHCEVWWMCKRWLKWS